MSTQRSSALQGIVGVFLALGIIGGISILGMGGLLSQSANSANDGAPAFNAPQAELLAPAPEAELVEPAVAPEPEDAPEPIPAERVADVVAPAEMVEEAAAGEAALEQEAAIIPEVDLQVEQVDLATDGGLPAREDLTRIFSILVLSAGVGVAVMLSMIFLQRRS